MAIIQAMAGTTVSESNGPIPDPPNSLNPDAPTQNTGAWLAVPSNLTTAPRGNVVAGTGGLSGIYGNIQPGLSRSKYVGNWGNSPYAPLVSTWFPRKTPIRTLLPDTYLQFDQNLGSENNYVLMWNGYFRAPNTAVYNFYLSTDDDGYFYLGNTAIAGWNATNAVVDSHPGPSVSANSVLLEQNKYYPVRMLFAEYSGAEKLQLHWNSNATPFTSGVAGNTTIGGSSVWYYNADIATGYTSIPPLSLVFNQPEADYLTTPASADWDLGTTWTIEFWINANSTADGNTHMFGGIWGLLNQGGWSTTNSINIALSDSKLVFLSGAGANEDVRYTEPTPNQWTHVAIVNDAGTQKVYYNGVEQTRVADNGAGTANCANSSTTLYIGALGGVSGSSHFDGKLALVRISNAVKYATAFTPTTTYGADADTKLFLSSDTPLIGSNAHVITNYHANTSTQFPITYTARQWLDGYSGGGANSALYILLADYPDASIIPLGAKAKVSGNAHVVVGSLATEAYGQPCWLIQFNNPNENIVKGTTVTLTWQA